MDADKRHYFEAVIIHIGSGPYSGSSASVPALVVALAVATVGWAR